MSSVTGLFSSTTPTAGIDPSSQAADDAATLAGDLNQFLTLLTTQLENQDPLDPVEGTEFTAQLVQFASVEQQIFQNSNLETLIELQEASSIANLVNFIGNEVQYSGQDFVLENSFAELTYSLPPNVSQVEINIVDPTSNLTIFNQSGSTDAGLNSFTYTGQQNNGLQAPDGQYLAIITAFDQNGGIVTDVAQTAFGRVTGAGLQNGDTSIFVGDILVDEGEILAVREPTTPETSDPVESP